MVGGIPEREYHLLRNRYPLPDSEIKIMPSQSEIERLEEKLQTLQTLERGGVSRRINPLTPAYPYVPGKNQYDEIKAEIAEIKKRLETPEWKEVNERQRTYKYDTFILTLNDVQRIKVSKSGNHYIECRTGKYIVSPGWRYVQIDVDNWTF